MRGRDVKSGKNHCIGGKGVAGRNHWGSMKICGKMLGRTFVNCTIQKARGRGETFASPSGCTILEEGCSEVSAVLRRITLQSKLIDIAEFNSEWDCSGPPVVEWLVLSRCSTKSTEKQSKAPSQTCNSYFH